MKLSRILSAVLLVGAVFMLSSGAMAGPFITLIGDDDHYGNLPGAGDQVPPGTNIWDGLGPSGTGMDRRNAAEKAATNGAQLTDIYSALFPAFGPNPSEKGSVIIPIPAGQFLKDAVFFMAMGDFQASTFGAIKMDFNGVSDVSPAPSTFNDGFQASAIRAFVLSPADLAAANAAGQVVVNFDHTGSGDFIAFDFFKLAGDTAPVPVPPSVLLMGTGLLGLVGFGIRRRKS